MDDDSVAALIDKTKEAITEVLRSTVADLGNTRRGASPGDKPLFFPDGINFINISVTFDPAKATFNGSLTISSQPVQPHAVAAASSGTHDPATGCRSA